MKRYELLTVDVWDTLLRRDTHPEAIKRIVALQIVYSFWSELREEYRSPVQLHKLRVEIEADLAASSLKAGFDGEYNLFDVFAVLFQRVFEVQPKNVDVTFWVDKEVDVEISRTYPDPHVFSFLNEYQASKVVFLSDFYLGAKQLTRLLAFHGLNSEISEGVVSCDVGLNKRAGRLFPWVHQKYDVKPDEHVHVGDSVHSDVEAPKMYGILGVEYKPEVEHVKRLENVRCFEDVGYLLKKTERTIREAQCEDLCRSKATAFQFGLKFSVVFVAFSLWVAECVAKSRIDKVFFASREGRFLNEVYRALFPQLRLFGVQLGDGAEWLDVSRLSTYFPSVPVISLDAFDDLWLLSPGGVTVSGLLRTLHLDPLHFSSILSDLNLGGDEAISRPNSDIRVERLLAYPKVRDALVHALVKSKNGLSRYLEIAGLTRADTSFAIADVGWRGSIQYTLQKMYPNVELEGLYLGLRSDDFEARNALKKRAYLLDENLSEQDVDLFSAFSLIESLCMGPIGSVQSYEIDSMGGVQCIRSPDSGQALFYERYGKDFQAGVLFAVPAWRDAIERFALTSSDFRDEALRQWEALKSYPADDLASVFLASAQEDGFGESAVFHRSAVPSLSDIAFSPFSARRRTALFRYIVRVQWPEVVRNAPTSGFVHSYMLRFVFLLASRYRRLKIKWNKWVH